MVTGDYLVTYHPRMDAVFRALADPTRRSLLDELFRQDGQPLIALERRLPMTRFGVMKHLAQLEEAGLVVTKRRGREKLHFLNPVPIRLVQTFRALWSDEVKSEGWSRVTWEIEPVGDSCKLLVVHDELAEDAHGEIYGGWPQILSGLKTLLETGEELTTPGSLLYANAASG